MLQTSDQSHVSLSVEPLPVPEPLEDAPLVPGRPARRDASDERVMAFLYTAVVVPSN